MKTNKLAAMLLVASFALAGCGNNANKEAEPAETKVEEKPETQQEEVKKDEATTEEDKKDESKEADSKEMKKEETESVDASKAGAKMLPDFKATDQEGNGYSKEDIAKNDATVINLWFTGCSACIEEMEALNDLATEIKGQEGVDFVSMCTDKDYDDSTKEAYERIMKDKKPTYQALGVEYEGAMKEFLENIFVYPTTIVVDKNGNVIGDPIEGALTIPEQQEKLQENINKAIESSKASK